MYESTGIWRCFEIKNSEEDITLKFKFVIENLRTFEPEVKISKGNLNVKIDEI